MKMKKSDGVVHGKRTAITPNQLFKPNGKLTPKKVVSKGRKTKRPKS